jgi:hypothetical protein
MCWLHCGNRRGYTYENLPEFVYPSYPLRAFCLVVCSLLVSCGPVAVGERPVVGEPPLTLEISIPHGKGEPPYLFWGGTIRELIFN